MTRKGQNRKNTTAAPAMTVPMCAPEDMPADVDMSIPEELLDGYDSMMRDTSPTLVLSRSESSVLMMNRGYGAMYATSREAGATPFFSAFFRPVNVFKFTTMGFCTNGLEHDVVTDTLTLDLLVKANNTITPVYLPREKIVRDPRARSPIAIRIATANSREADLVAEILMRHCAQMRVQASEEQKKLEKLEKPEELEK